MKKISLLCAALLLLAGCTVVPPAAGSEPPAISPIAPTVRPAEPLVPEQPEPAETPPAPVETPEPPAPPSPSAPLPVGWDGTLETLTLADFPTELVDAAASIEAATPLTLIAQLPEQDTWLYGYGSTEQQSIILRLGDRWQTLPLFYITPHAVLPQMAYGDYDGDLALELGLLLYAGNGTGASVWALHVVELGDESIWIDQHFKPEDYTAILDEMILFQYDAEIAALTLSAGESSLALTAPTFDGTSYVGPGPYGDVVSFALEGDRITAQFAVFGLFSDGPKPLAMVNAQVVYTGSAFGLSDLTLTPQ